MINGVLTEVQLTIGLVCPQTHSAVVSPVPEYIIGKKYFQVGRILTVVL